MDIRLEPVDPGRLEAYRELESGADLCAFTSRTRPFAPESGDDMLLWRYIRLEGKRIEAVWIEKRERGDETATLGIFIAPGNLRARGIGRAAIERAIAQSQDNMNCMCIELTVRENNERGYRCYRGCGFRETERFVKRVDGEEVASIRMERPVRLGD